MLGGAALGGGRGSMVAAMAGALALEALFTLLNLLGLPKPLRDAVQGLIIIGAVAYARIPLACGHDETARGARSPRDRTGHKATAVRFDRTFR